MLGPMTFFWMQHPVCVLLKLRIVLAMLNILDDVMYVEIFLLLFYLIFIYFRQ